MKRVVFQTRTLTHYRAPFHELVRNILAEQGVSYRLSCGTPSALDLSKSDLVSLPWADVTRSVELPLGLIWQSVPDFNQADLVIMGQENKYLFNYFLMARRLLGELRPKIAFFGHGRNFQSLSVDTLQERFKRLWINRVDWWFAYTEISAQVVSASGFSKDRITVFQNAVDTSAMLELSGSVREQEIAEARAQLGLSENVAIFVGGLYDLKRVDFMIEAALIVKELVGDFHLLVVGGGPEAGRVREASSRYQWIHYLGPKFGREKAILTRLAKLTYMPGLVGLGVLDAFAYGVPLVTTDYPLHSPEIAYLEHDRNGIVVPDWESASSYAEAVAELLMDGERRERLRLEGLKLAASLNVENMAQKFSAGVVDALSI